MKPTVYIETTIVSYLTAKPSRDLVVAARQQVTREWWERTSRSFELYASPLVWQEAAEGDAGAAQRRLAALERTKALEIPAAALDLAEAILASGIIPAKVADDAAHVAIGAVNGMDYLLTWNCTHIANAANRPRIELLVTRHGYRCPVICTPDELPNT